MNVIALCLRAALSTTSAQRARHTNRAYYLRERQRGAAPWRARLAVYRLRARAKWRAWLFVVLT